MRFACNTDTPLSITDVWPQGPTYVSGVRELSFDFAQLDRGAGGRVSGTVRPQTIERTVGMRERTGPPRSLRCSTSFAPAKMMAVGTHSCACIREVRMCLASSMELRLFAFAHRTMLELVVTFLEGVHREQLEDKSMPHGYILHVEL